jgi:hypothetical protein
MNMEDYSMEYVRTQMVHKEWKEPTLSIGLKSHRYQKGKELPMPEQGG